jgi:ABC-type polysaccharide/polyol phosphate transport system ATPase subunit
MCDRGVWLERGRVRMAGKIKAVVAAYLSSVTGAQPKVGAALPAPAPAA